MKNSPVKNSSIKVKVISVVVFCLLLGGAGIIALSNQTYHENIGLVAGQSLKTAAGTFKNLAENEVKMMSASIEALLGNDELRMAFAARDRGKLLKISAPIYESFNRRYGLTHWNYWEPEPPDHTGVKGLTNFFRTATPTRYGDFLERVTLARAVKTKTFAQGLDLGNTGFALRVIHPYFDRGKLIGYFELGKDVSSFLETMKKQTGNEYGLLIQKKYLDQKKWASSRTSRGLPNNWGEMKDVVLAKNTTKDELIFNYNGNLDQIPDQGQVLEIIKKNDSFYNRGVFPLYDAAGNKVGGVFVLQDITALHDAQNDTIIAIGVLTIVITLVLILMLNKLVFRRLRKMVETATRIVGGAYETRITVSSNDELGQFESLFDQFRQIFVNLLQELHGKNNTPVDPP